MSVDRHLLFGVLALQNEFIDRQSLVDAFAAWMKDRSKPIDQILVEQSALSDEIRLLLDQLVNEHVRTRAGDVQASLAGLTGDAWLRAELEKLADTEIHASISRLKQPENSISNGVGQNTSLGTRFEIKRPLDRGGLGIVSVAIDRELNREVALKEIRSDCADDAIYRKKFLLEAEVTGGLEHPNIVPVYGLGTYPDGRPYYAMRLIQGDNLRAQIKLFHSAIQSGQEPFDGPALRKLLRRFLDVCEAIDYAHARGILHRDLKPGNVMLGKYGETLVVDWGLAKSIATDSNQVKPSTEVSINSLHETPLIPSGQRDLETRQGSILGTAAYAPPEQLTGNLDEVGTWSDVYGLGAILYELLTGNAPGVGTTLDEVIANTTTGRIPRPRIVQPLVPRPLEAICLHAIHIHPNHRYQAASELRQDIERWLDDSPVSVYRESVSKRVSRWLRTHKTLAASASVGAIMTFLGLMVVTSIIGRNNIRLTTLNQDLDKTNSALLEANDREKKISKDLDDRRKELERERLELQLHNAYLDCEYGRVEMGLIGMLPVLQSAIATKNVTIENRVRRLISAWERDHTFRFPTSTLPLPTNAETQTFSTVDFNDLSSDGKFLLAGNLVEEPVPQATLKLFRKSATSTAEGAMRLVRDWSVEQIDSNPKLLAAPDRIVFVANDQLKVIEIDSLMQRSLPLPKHDKTEDTPIFSIYHHSATDRLMLFSSHGLYELDPGTEEWSLRIPASDDWRNAITVCFSPSHSARIAFATQDHVHLAAPELSPTTQKIAGTPLVTSIDFHSSGNGLYAGGIADKDNSNPLNTGWYQGWAWEIQNGKIASRETMERRYTLGNLRCIRSILGDQSLLVEFGKSFLHDSPNQLQLVSIGKENLEQPIASLGPASFLLELSQGRSLAGASCILLISGEEECTFWKIGTRSRLKAERVMSSSIVCSEFSLDGNYLFLGHVEPGLSNSTLERWTSSDLQPTPSLTNRKLGSVRSLRLKNNGEEIAWTGDSTGLLSMDGSKIRVLARNNKKEVHRSITFINQGLDLAILVDEDKSWILGNTPYGSVSIVSGSTGREIRSIDTSETLVLGVAVGPNNTLVTTCSDQTVRFWDPTTGMETSAPEVFASSVKLVLAGEESPIYAVVTTDGGLHLRKWQSDTEQITRNRVLQHKSRISLACMSRDGSFIATACEDGTVHFWDTQHGERLGQPIQHAPPVSSLALSRDGQNLFTFSGDTGRIWEVPQPTQESFQSLQSRLSAWTGIRKNTQQEWAVIPDKERIALWMEYCSNNNNADWPIEGNTPSERPGQ